MIGENVSYGYVSTSGTAIAGDPGAYWQSSSTQTVGAANYYYYGTGQLELVTSSDSPTSGITDASFYVYDSTSGDLAYVLGEDALLRLMAAANLHFNDSNPNLATELATNPYVQSNVGQYADDAITYTDDQTDNNTYTNYLVGSTTTNGATTTYTNTQSGLPDGYNTWSTEQSASQTADDGSTTTTTTFYNFEGDVMLTDVNSDGQDTYTYNRYDANGNLILTAEPSAVSGCNSALPDLINYADNNQSYPTYLNQATGLFDVNTYYASTTATASTPGGVAGRAYQTAVADGATQARIAIGNPGGPVLKSSTIYTAEPYDQQRRHVLHQRFHPISYGRTGNDPGRHRQFAEFLLHRRVEHQHRRRLQWKQLSIHCQQRGQPNAHGHLDVFRPDRRATIPGSCVRTHYCLGRGLQRTF